MKKIRIQVGLIVLVAVVWAWFFVTWWAVLVGGGISLLNTFLLYLHTKNQQAKLTINAKDSVNLMYRSVLTRIILLGFLILVGLWSGLEMQGFIMGFVVGQIGMLLNNFNNEILAKGK